jgi:hypothetical protein
LSSHKIGAVPTIQAVATWMSLILLNLSLLTNSLKSFTKLVKPFTNFIIRPKNGIHLSYIPAREDHAAKEEDRNAFLQVE